MQSKDNWSDITFIRSRWRWSNFVPEEFSCHGTGKYLIVPEFMDKLQALRHDCGFPLPINSGYRDPEYNYKISNTGFSGPHTTGRAVDIRASGKNAHKVISLAVKHGFTGIGLKQHGLHELRYIHLDDLSIGRPWVWTYP